MSKENALDLVREMRHHFLVPPAEEEVFSRIDNLIVELDTKYRVLGETFRHNLNSVLSSISMPFILASSSAHESQFQYIYHHLHSAAAIRAGLPEQLDEVREREVYRKAASRMTELLKTEEGREANTRGICNFLLQGLETPEVRLAARELVQQGIVMTWSAFEILFRDVFELELNVDPSKAELLANNASIRKRFEMEKFSLTTLIQHDLDLSGKVGTLLVRQQDLSDLPTLKSVYATLFASSAKLTSCLNSRDLWLLYQRRHLFVHRRGIVDQTYLEKTSDDVSLGSTLELTPKDFERHFEAVVETGEELLRCLAKRNST